MTVEKSTADDVRKKFETLQKDKDQPTPVDSVMDGRASSPPLTLLQYESPSGEVVIAVVVTADFALHLVLLFKGQFCAMNYCLDTSSTNCMSAKVCLQVGTEKC